MGQLDDRGLLHVPAREDHLNFAPTRLAAAERRPASAGGRTLVLAVPAAWTREAACVGESRLFDSEHYAQRAKTVCAGCPVRLVCLEAALLEEAGGPRFGVRGGLTASERARLDNGSREIA